ncbi:MAG: response regulator, partial [Gemmatimonadetes bacterium]|nr:response regulator [Gemmatimonadota bacterium]
MPEKTILLVEDNADERSIYATVLRHHGYRVLETWNGEDAIRIARQSHPDLVVLDIRLPSISGLTVSQVLRSSRVTSGIPILAISAAAPDPDVLEEVGC